MVYGDLWMLDKPELDWNRQSHSRRQALDTWLFADGAILCHFNAGGSLWILGPFDWTLRQDLGGSLWPPIGFRGVVAQKCPHLSTLAAFDVLEYAGLQYRFARKFFSVNCCCYWNIILIEVSNSVQLETSAQKPYLLHLMTPLAEAAVACAPSSIFAFCGALGCSADTSGAPKWCVCLWECLCLCDVLEFRNHW